MQLENIKFHKILMGTAACCVVMAGATAAYAGGLAVREQSAQFQGTSFAGNGAGGGLSSSFWNSAAIGEAEEGMTAETQATVLFNRQSFTVQPPGNAAAAFGGIVVGDSTNANAAAFITSSYNAYRINDKLVVGMAINAPFGVGTELDDKNGSFQLFHRSAKILTLNANPMASYQVMPGLFIGVGAQIQYIEAKFKIAAPAAAAVFPTAGLRGDDVGFGFTAGVLWKPGEDTSVGIGFRSAVKHEISGEQFNLGTGEESDFGLKITTPEMITASLRHEVVDNLTLLATVEWTNWDRVGVLPITGPAAGPLTGSVLDFQYHEGWFFALGGEYELSEKLTLRAGAAYELSPVQNPSERLVQVPDADRIWLSLGATYELNEAITMDFAYTHVFVESTNLSRVPATPALVAAGVQLNATTEVSADILSVAFKIDTDELMEMFQ